MPQRKRWIVVFDDAALRDFEDVTSRDERKAVLTAVHNLKELGGALPTPHMKSLKGRTCSSFALAPVAVPCAPSTRGAATS